VLPSDHHYSDEQVFNSALESAFRAADSGSGSIVVLSSPARGPETEYGWIELGQPVSGESTYRIRRFVEKPPKSVALRLFEEGALWNTFVMVGRVRDFLDMVGAARTGLLKAFPRQYLWNGAEVRIQDWLYERIYITDFSRDILSTQPDRLLALPFNGVIWNDLGHPERVMDVLQACGQKPWWVKEWHALRRPPVSAVTEPLVEAAVA